MQGWHRGSPHAARAPSRLLEERTLSKESGTQHAQEGMPRHPDGHGQMEGVPTSPKFHNTHRSASPLASIYQRLSTGIQHKAFVKLMGLEYTIQYKRGITNAAADALSRQD